MPILILFIAIILVIAGINNQLGLLSGLVKEDVSPSDGSISFGVWVLAIAIAGALGYVKALKPLSNGFLALIFIGIIVSAQKGNQSGFFSNLQKAFKNLGAGLPASNAVANSTSSLSSNVSSILSNLGSSGSGDSSIGSGSLPDNIMFGS